MDCYKEFGDFLILNHLDDSRTIDKIVFLNTGNLYSLKVFKNKPKVRFIKTINLKTLKYGRDDCNGTAAVTQDNKWYY